MNEFVLYQAAVAVCMVLSAFFSATETALVSARKLRIRALADAGDAGARRALSVLHNSEETIAVILIGNNIVNIAATSFLTYIAVKAYYLNDQQLVWVVAAQAGVFLLLCELLPKLAARGYADLFIRYFSLPIAAVTWVLKPVVIMVTSATSLMKKIFSIENSGNQSIRSREEIELLFEIGGEHGAIDEDHQLFVSEILSFKELTARDIMTPTVEIESVEEHESVKSLVLKFQESGFSRLPVYRERVDAVIGYIFYRDLFEFTGKTQPVLKDLMKPAVYIPGTKTVFDLHNDMIRKQLSLVFVVDEYGGVIGMITHEDVAEEVVGEIQTRDHDDEIHIKKIHATKYLLDGSLSIEYIKRHFGLEIEKRGFETIAGYLMYVTGSIPQKGERIPIDNALFIIEEADERSIKQVVMNLLS